MLHELFLVLTKRDCCDDSVGTVVVMTVLGWVKKVKVF